MKANNQQRTATFREGVEMLHLPVDTPDQQIPFDDTVNKLPPGALYLTSNENEGVQHQRREWSNPARDDCNQQGEGHVGGKNSTGRGT